MSSRSLKNGKPLKKRRYVRVVPQVAVMRMLVTVNLKEIRIARITVPTLIIESNKRFIIFLIF